MDSSEGFFRFLIKCVVVILNPRSVLIRIQVKFDFFFDFFTSMHKKKTQWVTRWTTSVQADWYPQILFEKSSRYVGKEKRYITFSFCIVVWPSWVFYVSPFHWVVIQLALDFYRTCDHAKEVPINSGFHN